SIKAAPTRPPARDMALRAAMLRKRTMEDGADGGAAASSGAAPAAAQGLGIIEPRVICTPIDLSSDSDDKPLLKKVARTDPESADRLALTDAQQHGRVGSAQAPTLDGYTRPVGAPNPEDITREQYHQFMLGKPEKYSAEL
ncbi:unnamed protein product, partial [Prorocentrum cordatum]